MKWMVRLCSVEECDSFVHEDVITLTSTYVYNDLALVLNKFSTVALSG